MAFLTRSDAIEWIAELDPTSTAENDVIDRLLTVVEAFIAGFLGYAPASAGATPTIEDTTYTHFSGAGIEVVEDGAAILCSMYPIQSVTNAYDDTTWAYETAESSDDYVIEGAHGIVRLKPNGGWVSASTSARAVKLVYVAGYTSVPAPIVQAGYMLVRRMFSLRRTADKTSMSEGGISVGLAMSAMSDDVKRLLEPYVLIGAIP